MATGRTSGAPAPLAIEELTLEDLGAVRLMLRGSSVIDWYQLDFDNESDVDRFLRVNEFDPRSPTDMDRLEALRLEAVEYLEQNFEKEIPEVLAEGMPARDLLLMASRRSKLQLQACMILKVMHIVHHLSGRDLSTRLPIPSDQIYNQIELKVMRVVEELRAAGHPIVEFEWSRKTQSSLITKLLAKRSTLAANIYDKIRFRMIVRSTEDLVPMLVALHRLLIPFNYVVPGESVNHLLPLGKIMRARGPLGHLASQLQFDTPLEKKQDRAAKAPINEFSGSQYRIINFIADLPVRVDSFVDNTLDSFGNVVFVLTEFQLVDKETAVTNERGESSHDAYKTRQHQSVEERLVRSREIATKEQMRVTAAQKPQPRHSSGRRKPGGKARKG